MADSCHIFQTKTWKQGKGKSLAQSFLVLTTSAVTQDKTYH